MLINRFGVAKPLELNVNGKEENYIVPSGESYEIGDILLNDDDSVKGVAKTGGTSGSTITIIVPAVSGGSSGDGHTHSGSPSYQYSSTSSHKVITTCSICGEKMSETTQAHTFTNGTCSLCGYTQGTTHTHTPTTIPAVAATCTSYGYTQGTKCSSCGAILTAPQQIPMANHTEGTQWYANSTEHSKRCTVCQARINVSTHSWDSWGNDTTGLNHKRTCQVCGKSVTEAHETSNTRYYAQETASLHERHWTCSVCGVYGHTSEPHRFVNGTCSLCGYKK